jgi:hypothetical protein
VRLGPVAKVTTTHTTCCTATVTSMTTAVALGSFGGEARRR